MELFDLKKELAENSYPGRGIVIGQSEDGRFAAIAYFIMGRSVNSRNRVFVEDGEGLRTRAFDPGKLSDPSLVIYAPVRVLGNATVVTNGDQTDTVYDFMKEGKTFEEALCTRTFEPDAPNYTPRISGVVERTDGAFTYKLSILKSGDGDPDAPERFFFAYTPKAGKGHFLHTYRCDGNPIPSFDGEPTPVKIEGDLDAFTRLVWESLNEDNKVSLFTRFINLETGEWESRIVNKNQ
ncbi:MAG: IMP cyclohydrolase [Clostridia bacterium]|nr:IMP cyclohydrolase [Clostridia bacterium]MDD7483140.1 IMP cyclohydrolase [Clostridia bacterium]MDY5557992.1 IMP cyclohydrolase [Candidatus Heritagella sp.]